jgi:hypothetical protein
MMIPPTREMWVAFVYVMEGASERNSFGQPRVFTYRGWLHVEPCHRACNADTPRAVAGLCLLSGSVVLQHADDSQNERASNKRAMKEHPRDA